MNTIERLADILAHFQVEGKVERVAPLGNGLINDTYKVETESGSPDYVLQRINTEIFPDVDMLQSNIAAVTAHIRGKLVDAGDADVDRRVLTLVKTTEGFDYYRDREDDCWRMTVYIERSHTVDVVNVHTALDAGHAFGHFEAMLADLPVSLGEVIPGFHNMELRGRQLREAVRTDRVGRVAQVRDMLAELVADIDGMCVAERLYRAGELPKRICHCDTKVNNMLLDEDGGVLCVIDLDTVMPSYVFSDYGDFLRTAANEVAEDCERLQDVRFREDVFEAFTAGYLRSTVKMLTDVERNGLPFAVQLFPFMQCARFLTDFINGDVYYKISYPEHNLVRARNQHALYRQTVRLEPYMRHYIASLPLSD